MSPLKIVRETREDIRNRDPLGEFMVWWDEPTTNKRSLLKCLNAAETERPIQVYLEKHPTILAYLLGGGHGRWVIPQKRLGAEFVSDFIIGEKSSIGFEWEVIELESPKSPMFTNKGDPSKTLTHAIRQIQDWRSWLKKNQDYASRSRNKHGLGLSDIDSNCRGSIFIGRREQLRESDNERRRQMMSDLRIDIHSFDFLVDTFPSRNKQR